MNIFILGLVACVGIASGYIIQLPGQCKPESAFKIEDVIYKVEDLVGTYYQILATNNGPYGGVASTRTLSINEDGRLNLTESYKSFNNEIFQIRYDVTPIPNSRGYTLIRHSPGNDIVNAYEAYLLHYGVDKDLYAGYACRNISEDYREEEFAVWSSKRFRVDEEVLSEVHEIIRKNDMYDTYDFLQVVQQPCCQVDADYCIAPPGAR